jgi:hypothetical protein
MSTQPLTLEGLLGAIEKSQQAADKRREAADKRWEAADKRWETTRKKIDSLGDRIGEIVEDMVKGGIVDKFRALGYNVTQCSQNVEFGLAGTTTGEVDLFLENGDIAVLIEVKTTLTIKKIRKHVKRLETYRQYADLRGGKRRFIGAVAGAVFKGEAKSFAIENGLYVIAQSGKAFEIVALPKGFKAKAW